VVLLGGGRVIRLARFLVFAVLIFLVVSQAAQAATFRSPALEAKLPTPVPVFCTDNTSASYALIVEREIYLDAPTCQSLLHGKPSTDGHGGYSWAQNAHTLLHEWVHVAFQTWDEKRVECIAYGAYRYWLGAYWGITGKRAGSMYRATLFSFYAPLGCVL
jgi:hypothetical protein